MFEYDRRPAATILGNGMVCLILDIDGLQAMDKHRDRASRRPVSLDDGGPAAAPPAELEEVPQGEADAPHFNLAEAREFTLADMPEPSKAEAATPVSVVEMSDSTPISEP